MLKNKETQPSAPTTPSVAAEKKRVPLISVPNGASNETNPPPAEDQPAPKKRVELITLSTKPLSQ